ncbi:DUF6304 family protein [Streptomyces sp. NPDC058307]|uniref:DUF6304 family protein n=1 Tax=Streptomyces sp. NPDC058307 TaxID=3346439 RepID=UPI0036E51848
MTALQRWPGRYTDRHGTEETVFASDGRQLTRTTIRGVRVEDDSGESPELMVCSCLLDQEVPIPAQGRGSGVRPGVLR